MLKRSPKGEGVIPIPQLGHKVFPGNTQEINTLIPTIDDLKKEFSVENIDFAADRGMFSEANIETLEKAKLTYVVAAKDKKDRLRLVERLEKIASININKFTEDEK